MDKEFVERLWRENRKSIRGHEISPITALGFVSYALISCRHFHLGGDDELLAMLCHAVRLCEADSAEETATEHA